MEKSDSCLSASLLGGSEEIFEFACQPCLTENQNVEAFGYCETCKEYLCNTCYTCHRKTSMSRHHKLLDRKDMPKIKPSDVLTENCSTHQGKLIEYYCMYHSQLCCIVCLNKSHGSCQVISHILDVSDGIATSNEFKQLMTDLKAMVTKLTKQQGQIKLSSQDNDKYQTDAIAGIRNFRQEVDNLMEKFEENAMMKLSELNLKNSEKITAASAECQAVLSDVTAMIAGLDTKAKSGKNNQLYVSMKLAQQYLVAVKTSEATECNIVRYRFHQDDKLQEMMSALSALWTLSVSQDSGESKARYRGEVHVKSADDQKDCNISGVVTLPRDRIVVSDYDNECIKMVDARQSMITSRLMLSSQPSDLTIAGPNQVAVSLPMEGKIELVTVTNVLSRSHTIKVDKDGYGLCFIDDKFCLADLYSGLVNVIDTSGTVLYTLSTDSNGDPLFKQPRRVTPGRNNDVIYVIDIKGQTVTTMTLRGHVISVNRRDKLMPLGFTVGPDHKVYVCSEHTHTIVQLSATGDFLQVLLDKQRGLSSYPRVIAYDDTTDHLYISSGSSEPRKGDYLKVFQIE